MTTQDDKNTTTQNPTTPKEEDTPTQTGEVIETPSLSNKVTGEAKRILSRLRIHLASIGIGFLTGLYLAFNKDTSSLAEEATNHSFSPVAGGMLTYVSLLLIFPAKTNFTASFVGMVSAGIAALAGFGILGLAFGAIAAFIVNTINQRKVSFGSLIALILLAFNLKGLDSLANVPWWYQISFITLIGAGAIFPTKINSFFERIKNKVKHLFPNMAEQANTPTIELPAQDVVEITESVDKPDPAVLGFDPDIFTNKLQEIQAFKKDTPPELLTAIDDIDTKTRAIIQCMIDDPRDVPAGKKFLTRYLPIIHTSIERLIRLAQQNTEHSVFEKTKEQTQQALESMAKAFGDMHTQLLSNDVDDLIVDLRLMNTLLKSDGYKISRE